MIYCNSCAMIDILVTGTEWIASYLYPLLFWEWVVVSGLGFEGEKTVS